MTTIEYREVADDLHETRASVNADGSKSLEGYAIRFDVWSQDLGGFRERLSPDSTDATLRARNDVKALVNHESRLVIGSTRAKTLVLESTAQGVRDHIALPDTSYANDLHTVVDRGDVRGQSFGFSVPRGGDAWNSDFTERTVLALRLHEVSVVTFPAYVQTSVSARSLAMFEAESGRDREDLATAWGAFMRGEMTAEHADTLIEAVQRKHPRSDEAADVVEQIEDVRDADPEAVADELYARRVRLALRQRTARLV